jgi:hypothetical protein
VNARTDWLTGLVVAATLCSAAWGALNKWELAEVDARECVKINPQFAKGEPLQRAYDAIRARGWRSCCWAGYHRLASAQKKLGKTSEAIATLKAAQSNTADAEKVPAIKKLLRDLNQEASKGAAPAAAGGRQLPPAVAKELQELQPPFLNNQRDVEPVRRMIQGRPNVRGRLMLWTRIYRLTPSCRRLAARRSVWRSWRRR